jgi:tetratricopeptide (TPR) repeat protein
MTALRALARLALPLVCALAFIAGQAGAQAPLTRTQALAALERPEPMERATAVARLAEVGRMADVDTLLRRLRDDDEQVRELANVAIWRIWGRSGDRDIDALFERGVAQMEADDMPAALETFNEIVRRKPAFAEGWNKRATILFLLERFDASLQDCLEVLKRNPQHYGALSGMGQIHLQRGDLDTAARHFERALRINPNLSGVAGALQEIERERARTPRVST